MHKKQTKGYVIWEGPSLLDGAPVVAVAILHSDNVKTGDMVQTFILRADVEPHIAIKTGQDFSVCGDCKHRPINGGACYVTVHQAPLSVYRAYRRGNYPRANAAQVGDLVQGRMVRLGAYGDPAAVPAQVWEDLTAQAAGRTGYTHQWANEALPASHRAAIARLTMASVDNVEEALQAQTRGIRYFRIRAADEALQPREFICPASDEGGMRKTCATCGACNGTQRAGQASPVIIVHGAVSKVRAFTAQRAA